MNPFNTEMLWQSVHSDDFLERLGDSLDPNRTERFLTLMRVADNGQPRLCPSSTHKAEHNSGKPPTRRCHECVLDHLSPNELRTIPTNSGVISLGTLIRHGLTPTNLYCDFIARFDPIDVVFFETNLAQTSKLVFTVGRSRPGPAFTTVEMSRFLSAADTVGSLIRAHWLSAYSNVTHESADSCKDYIDIRVRRFTDNQLTEREHEVIVLLLQGFSSKEIAQMLCIASQTEKVHRRNAYAKLGVRSQGQLFGAFLTFLSKGESSRRRPYGARERIENSPIYFLSGKYEPSPRSLN